MAKFCGKCGSRLDEATGLCPNCDAHRLEELAKAEGREAPKAKPTPEQARLEFHKAKDLDEGAAKEEPKKPTPEEPKTPAPEAPPKKPAAKAAPREEPKTPQPAKKRRSLKKALLIVLALAILIGGAAGALLYFGGFLGQTDGAPEDSEFSMLEGKFSEIKVVDGQSAIQAAQEGAEKLGISEAAEELTLDRIDAAEDLTYYRLQQNYEGYPVYGKTFVVIADSNGDVSGMTANSFAVTLEEKEPSITQERADRAIRNYITDMVGTSELDYLDIEEISEDNLCIYTEEDQSAKLAYKLFADCAYGNFIFFVDSNSAEILFCQDGVMTVQKEFRYNGQTGPQTFVAEAGTQGNEMRYVGPDGVNVTVYTPKDQHQYDWYYSGNADVVSWSGDNAPDASAVDAMRTVSGIYRYYLETFQRSSFSGLGEDINVYIHTIGYRDNGGNDNSMVNNAYFTIFPTGPIISFTKRYDGNGNEINDYSCEIDAAGHEFTHGVVAYTSQLRDTKTNKMPQAINEAVSDILGYCAEAKIQGKKIDWVMSVRSAIKAENTGQAYHMDDYKGSKKECHSASTIVSYAAYLMNTSKDGTINDDEIARLWYHTILTLPSNCTFTVLRQHVEMAAKNLRFTQAQQSCIAKAFDAVGITLDAPKADNEYNPDITLKVYDSNSAAYDDYTISIDGKYNTGWFGWSWFGWFQEEYSAELDVQTAQPQDIHLPDHGEYTIKISDNKDSEEVYEKFIQVEDKYTNSVISFATSYNEKKPEKTDDPPDRSDVPSDAVQFNGHYYKRYDNGLTWTQAKNACEQVGGHLVTITGQSEQNFLASYVQGAARRSYWIGLTDEKETDRWTWVTDEPFGYSNWAMNEPNHGYGGIEHYAAIVSYDTVYDYDVFLGQWNDHAHDMDLGNFGYICEWDDAAASSGEQPTQTPGRTTSDERDVVLVLDTSGSMSGTPMAETQKASVNFIETVLQQDASIGIVTYENSADRAADFSVDRRALEDVVSGIYAGGGTNIEAGLREAHSMLSASRAKKKIIVLMSDGEPNDGRQGDDLVAYADEIKADGVLIYTLGFFENMGGSKSSAQRLMERIASDGCHYEVASADELIFFFEDMADQINGQKYIYVRIACPVDVTVTYNGETLTSEEEALNTRTQFGTLSFEENEASANGDDRIKVLRLKDGVGYDVQIVGTGRGVMDYTIAFMDENGDYSDQRTFEDVKINKNTVIDTQAVVSDETVLNIDNDGDGEYDLRLRAEENGYGEEVKQASRPYIAIGVTLTVFVILIVVLSVLLARKQKKERE